jgi:hypothetical protein
VDYIEGSINVPLRSEAPTNKLLTGFTVAKHEHREDKFVVNVNLFEATKGAVLPCDHLAGALIKLFYAPPRKTRKETETSKHGQLMKTFFEI